MIYDAIGHIAVGQVPNSGPLSLNANVGAFTLTGNAVTFSISEAASAGAFVLTGYPSFQLSGIISLGGTFTLSGKVTTYILSEAASPGPFILTGLDSHFTRDFINWLPSARPSSTWTISGSPSGSWAPAGQPSNDWTIDPDQLIPPPEEI